MYPRCTREYTAKHLALVIVIRKHGRLDERSALQLVLVLQEQSIVKVSALYIVVLHKSRVLPR